MRIYVPGANRTGRAAWPHSTDEKGLYAAFPEDSSIAERTRLLGELPVTASTTIIAHSLGALPALMAIQAGRLDVCRLVLLEPALFDIVRGNPCVEEHIALLTRARKKASQGNLFGYWELVKPHMFGRPALTRDWDHDEPHAARFSLQPAPWGHDVTARTIEGLPTLVVTGGWNEPYEAMASVLQQHGAVHRLMPGSGHRPQDRQEFEALIRDFEQDLPH